MRHARARRLAQVVKRAEVSWESALREYLLVKKAQGLRESTLGAIRETVSLMFRRYPGAWENPREGVLRFLSENVKPATFNYRLSYLKGFFSWAAQQGYVPENPAEGFKKRKAGHRIVDIPEGTLRRLLQLPDRSTYVGRRDYALICLQLDCGVRPREACRLLPGDVDLQSGWVHIRPEVAKTKVGRSLPITPATAKAIRELLAARPESWVPDVPVFASQDGTELSKYSWEDRLKLYSQRLGVHITPYSLRHCFALGFVRAGGNALALRRIMGHATLDMTKQYVALADSDIRQQHEAASPLATLISQRGTRAPRKAGGR